MKLIFGTTRKSLEKCVEKIEDDRSFQNYGGEISGTSYGGFAGGAQASVLPLVCPRYDR